MKGARGPPDLDHGRPRPDPLRARRGRHPHPRGSRPGRQHHPRRDLRREPRGHDPRLGRRDRHRPGADRRRARSSATEQRIAEVAERLRAEARARVAQTQPVPSFRSAPPAEALVQPMLKPAAEIAPAQAAMLAPAHHGMAPVETARHEPLHRSRLDAGQRRPDADHAEAGRGLRGPAGPGAALPRRRSAREFVPPAGRTPDPAGPHAAGRRPAGAGPEPDPGQPRRGARSRQQAHDPAAAPGDGRLRPPRGSRTGSQPTRCSAQRHQEAPRPSSRRGPRGIRQADVGSAGLPSGPGPARPAGPPRAGARRPRTTSSRSRPSCAASPTDPHSSAFTRRPLRTLSPGRMTAGGSRLKSPYNSDRLRFFQPVTERKKA